MGREARARAGLAPQTALDHAQAQALQRIAPQLRTRESVQAFLRAAPEAQWEATARALNRYLPQSLQVDLSV